MPDIAPDIASEQHGLKRELRLGDLVLMQVLLIVGLNWIGNAGEQGSTHVFLWLAGILFFYIPLGTVVILLSRAMPLEGGTYQWVKAGVSPFAGYLAAWNSSFYTITVFGTMGPTLVNSLAYMAGPSRRVDDEQHGAGHRSRGRVPAGDIRHERRRAASGEMDHGQRVDS